MIGWEEVVSAEGRVEVTITHTVQVGSDLSLCTVPVCEKFLLVIEELFTRFSRKLLVLCYNMR
jgi:hypothetical protein